LALNLDSKFKNINDIIKVYCDPKALKSYKEQIDSLIEQNTKIKYELEMTKVQLNKKDSLVNSYHDKLKEQELIMTKLKSKVQNIKDLNDESKQLRDYIKDLKCELEFLREKEGKLMKVIYSIHKKGIAIDDILTENIQIDSSNDISTATYYFPDKFHMDVKKENVPMLDLGSLPGYETLRAREEALKDSTIYFKDIVVDENKSKKKPKDYNTEFLQKYDEYSESWRKDIKQVKAFKEFLKKKK
jgi:hypothetical protein